MVLELAPETPRKHFRREFDRGMVEADVKVAQSLFNMATSGNNVAAAIFWMKSRAGWREKNSLEITDKDGTPPLPTKFTVQFASPDGRVSDRPPGDGEAADID